MTPLFRHVLGEDVFARLPPAVRALHSPGPRLVASGEAEVEGAEGWLAALGARLIGLPPGGVLPVQVEIVTVEGGETWTRQFGRHRFTSHLRAGARPGEVVERFGVVAFTIALHAAPEGLHWSVTQGRCLGLPIPRGLLPAGPATEQQDEAGRFRFEVDIRLPLGLGRVVRYRGWLRADIAPAGA